MSLVHQIGQGKMGEKYYTNTDVLTINEREMNPDKKKRKKMEWAD